MDNIDLKTRKKWIKKCLSKKHNPTAQIAAVGLANSIEEGNSRMELLEFIKDWGILTANKPLEEDVDRMLYEKEGINL
jgi:hypothetical protein